MTGNTASNARQNAPGQVLSRQQIKFFNTFGYLVIPGLLKTEITQLGQLFDDIFAQAQQEIIDWRHEAHYMMRRDILMQFIERDARLSSLLEHPLIDGVFTDLLGKDYLYRASDGNVFTGDTYWHSDLYGAYFKYRHIKILFYLEPLHADNGAFQAIPGSHLFGDKFANLLERWVWKHEENYGINKDEVPGVTLPTQPGDALIFDYRLKHATSRTAHPRRMFSICASQRFAEEDLEHLSNSIKGFLPMSGGQLYYPDFLTRATATQRSHIDQCLRAAATIQAV